MSVTSTEIVKVAIYPSIGIARVGNSPEAYFIGPEIPKQMTVDPSFYRDESGRIKRQAARFRLYGLNARGEIVKEITSDDADIVWRAHVANKKAAWYNFDLAFDIPSAQTLFSERRNPEYVLDDRKKLIIDPGQREITGSLTNADGLDIAYAFDTGTFVDKSVYLGELRTDEKGRLIFLGGRGVSEAVDHEELTDFANNNNWHDDISDGPINATVVINGATYEAESAWVIVSPPNYAPDVQAIVTGYDLLLDAAIKMDASLKPVRPEFYEHIYPILKRMTDYQWVNAGFALEFGWGSRYDFSDPGYIERLKDNGETNLPLRQNIYQRFRSNRYSYLQADSWPRIYGDDTTINPKTKDPREWMALVDIQMEWLKQWADGDFDCNEGVAAPKAWEDMSPSEQAEGLTRAALEETIGGPFHPGAEFTWIMRNLLLYSSPFRLKKRQDERFDWGKALSSSKAMAIGGPLDGSSPGDITRWMAVPWQTDTSSCLSSYSLYMGEYLPTFWPARVPNDVMTQEQYDQMMHDTATIENRLEALNPKTRPKWLRGIVYTDDIPAQSHPYKLAITQFVRQWSKIGIVVRHEGPKQSSVLPKIVWIEKGRDVRPIEPDHP